MAKPHFSWTRLRLRQVLGLITDTITNQFTIHLFINDIVPDIDTPLSELVEADFSGYEPKAFPAWGAVVNQPNGAGRSAASVVTFNRTSGHISNEVFGAFVLTPTAALFQSVAFGYGIQMDAAGKNLSVLWGQSIRNLSELVGDVSVTSE